MAVALLLVTSACVQEPQTTGSSSAESTGSSSPQSTGSASVGTTPDTSTEEPGLTCWTSPANGTHGPLTLNESAETLGLLEPLVGMHGHAAAFGDIDGDYVPDLFFGTFGDREFEAYQFRGADGPVSDQLLLSGGGLHASEDLLDELGRTSGSAFADLDADGDNDLILIRHAGSSDSTVPSRVYVNNGSLEEGPTLPLPEGFYGRTPAIADFDLDGLLDIYISEDKHGDTGGILLKNTGGLEFEDVTSGSGLEANFALGATAADLDGDGLSDLVTSTQIFLNNGEMGFVDITPDGYLAEPLGNEDDPAGVAVGDLNRDGIPDLVLGQHNRLTVEEDLASPVRIFVGADSDDQPTYVEVTEESGVVALPTLAPHVFLADLNNDGWLDILTSASAEGGTQPAIHMNEGTTGITFENPDGLGSDQYWVGAPVTDLNRDGRLDIFALEWEPSLPSLMFMNETESGHWLEVSIDGPGLGVGAVVTLTDPGNNLIGSQEISTGAGYSSGSPAIAHFGLGDLTSAMVSISLPDGTMTDLGEVEADQHFRWPEGCS